MKSIINKYRAKNVQIFTRSKWLIFHQHLQGTSLLTDFTQSSRRTLQFVLKFTAPSVSMSSLRLFLMYAFRDDSAITYHNYRCTVHKQGIKVIWHKDRNAAAHGRFSCIHQVAPMWPPYNTCFLGSTQVHTPNGMSSGLAVFAQHTTERPYTLQWATPSPSKLPLPTCDLDPI